MVFLLCFLILLIGIVGIVLWLVISRVLAHMREDENAAKLISEHVITPILKGKMREAKEVPEP